MSGGGITLPFLAIQEGIIAKTKALHNTVPDEVKWLKNFDATTTGFSDELVGPPTLDAINNRQSKINEVITKFKNAQEFRGLTDDTPTDIKTDVEIYLSPEGLRYSDTLLGTKKTKHTPPAPALPED